MTDHRRLQRTLFRMQADPAFAHALLDGEASAVASTGLGSTDLELLSEAHPDALAADPGGRRRLQVLGNAASEYLLTLGAAARRPALDDLLEGFARAPEFHAAVAADDRLPLAFARYGLRRVREAGERELEAVLALERAMAELRRGVGEAAPARASIPSPHPPGADRAGGAVVAAEGPGDEPLAPGALRLARSARLLALPEGTLALCDALRGLLDRPEQEAPLPVLADGEETVLLWRLPAVHAFRLPDVQVEALAPPADRLFAAARRALAAGERERFARSVGAEPAELERFLAPFVEAGVLDRGA